MSSALKNFIITFCVSLLLFGLLSYIIVANVGQVFNNESETTGEENNSEDTKKTNIPSVTTAPLETETDINGNTVVVHPKDDSFTVLLVGTDYQPNTLNDYDLSELNKNISGFPIKEREIYADSIMILRADRKNSRFLISMLPSNMNVSVRGNKAFLGSLYEKYGIDFMCDMVTAMTGLKIDYYSAVSIEDFAYIIDDIGGINYTVPLDMNYEDPSQDLSIHIQKGARTLDGNTVVQMLRYNLYPNGNSDRMQLGISFFKALFEKMTDLSNLDKTSELFTNLSKYVETNITAAVVTRHTDILFAYRTFNTVVVTYPGSIENTDGTNYFMPDYSAALSLYKEYR